MTLLSKSGINFNFVVRSFECKSDKVVFDDYEEKLRCIII